MFGSLASSPVLSLATAPNVEGGRRLRPARGFARDTPFPIRGATLLVPSDVSRLVLARASNVRKGDYASEDSYDGDEDGAWEGMSSSRNRSATVIRTAGRDDMYLEVDLPAHNMGITFTCGPDATIAMVEKVRQGSAAEQAGIEIGDILFSCSAVELTGSDTPVVVGNSEGTDTHWRRIDDFRCLGQPFDVQMAAFNSTAIVDAGFKHRIVRAMFRRDVNPDGRLRASRLDEMLGDEKAGTDPTGKDAETSGAKLVTESWKDIVSAVTMEGVGELLFKILFEKDWDLVRLFPFRDCENWEQVKADPKFQSHAVNVAGAIDTAVSLLGNPSELVPVLQGLGKRHHGYGVEEEHYDVLGSALLETLEEGTALSKVSPGGRGWTRELRDAWTETWVTVAATMKGDLYGTSSK